MITVWLTNLYLKNFQEAEKAKNAKEKAEAFKEDVTRLGKTKSKGARSAAIRLAMAYLIRELMIKEIEGGFYVNAY